ncbi:hypothetical protein G3256_06505 [Roseobacter ponti]|uniref:D-galactarate dehydratase n=1 Tax=Roseobacter ponti TaxID=1891787 RepID=A0A858SVZ5_9RHOB|nr:hypothetical protein G3256_06505 [Roseobacter ponti]
MRGLCAVLLFAGLSGCADWQANLETLWGAPVLAEEPEAVAAGPATPEALDTTTPQEREAAVTSASSGAALGMTVASLGSPAEPGFWLKTALVQAETPGSVTEPLSGRAVSVMLIPIEGPPTSGSRLSLAAMRVLGVPLTDLIEVEVRRGG